MKRLLIPLIAALALPTAANSENVFLLIKSKAGSGYDDTNITSFVVPMASMDLCEEAGVKILASKRFNLSYAHEDGFECVRAK